MAPKSWDKLEHGWQCFLKIFQHNVFCYWGCLNEVEHPEKVFCVLSTCIHVSILCCFILILTVKWRCYDPLRLCPSRRRGCQVPNPEVPHYLANVIKRSLPPRYPERAYICGHTQARQKEILWCLAQRVWARNITFVINVPLQELGKRKFRIQTWDDIRQLLQMSHCLVYHSLSGP